MNRKLRVPAMAVLVAFSTVFVFAPALPAAAQQASPAGYVNFHFPVHGPLSDGGSFRGTATITQLVLNDTYQVEATGTLDGVATLITGQTVNIVAAPFTTTLDMQDPPLDANGAPQATCDILFLFLGPIFLDVLGLQVFLTPVLLDIDAISGAGNLLGNLLCAVAHLLDHPGQQEVINILLGVIY